MNSTVRQILMKKLLKSGIYGSMNSAHYGKINKYGLKKKKRKNMEEAKRGRDKLDLNTYLEFVWIALILLKLKIEN